MEKIKLPDVTLVAVTSKRKEEHQKVLDKCCEHIEFGDVKLIDLNTHTIDEWNKAMVYDLGEHINTSHALIVHEDGYIKDPSKWKDEWLQYDYAGAPFPLPNDDFSYRDVNGEIQRVGNSVGLRSKKLMDLPKKIGMEWRPFHGFYNEDGYICVNMRHVFEEHGCKFMPFEEAIYFSKEHDLPENRGLSTFMFHRL